jgi:hypothetical protein
MPLPFEEAALAADGRFHGWKFESPTEKNALDLIRRAGSDRSRR